MSRTTSYMPSTPSYGSDPRLEAIGRTPAKCRAEADALRAKVESIFAKADAESRDLTDGERAEVESHAAEISRLNREERILDNWRLDDATRPATGTAGASKPTEWRDSRTGQPIYILRPENRWSDLPGREELRGASLGELIRAAATGDWRRVSPGIKMVQSEGADSAGGFTVPHELLGRVVDKARARSFIMRAGASMIPMSTETLTLARVSADPSFEVKSENSAFSGSDISFDALNFVAKTVGCLITCSRELVEDSPNFSELVENTLANSFAVALDSIGVNGVASSSLDGILDWSTTTGIGETGSVGAISWEDLGTAVEGIQTANFEPTGYVCHPTIAYDLSVLTSGDGVNSSKNWLGPPPTVAPLRQFVTTNISTASVIVGEWNQFVWAIRQGARIEVSREAGDSFAKHQVLIKLTWRGDTGAFRRQAFHRLVGITT